MDSSQKTALVRAVEDVLDILAECEPQPAFIARFQSCRDRLAADPNDAEALQELYILSAPKGFLGDGPLYARPAGTMTQGEINRRSRELVERIQAKITKRGT